MYNEDNSLLVYGCSAQYLNLLRQDMTPFQIIQNTVKIEKYFHNHDKPNAFLKDIPCSVKSQLAGNMRWKNQIDFIESIHHNRQVYQIIVEDHDQDIDNNIANLINNYNLYMQSKDLLSQLKLIADYLYC